MAKKMPQPVLRKILFQARYKPELNFYNLLYPAAMQFSNYKHWETNNLSVSLFDHERRCTLGIHHNNFYYDWDYGGTSLYLDNIREAIEQLSTSLQLKGFIRIGLRQQLLISVNMDFTEINSILNVKFLSQSESLLKLFPDGIDDMSYITVGTDDTMGIRLLLGPMRKAEIPNHIQVNEKHHFSPDRPDDYVALLNSYPEVAVFIDMDVSKSEQLIELTDAISFVDKAKEKLDNKITTLRDYIFTRQVEL